MLSIRDLPYNKELSKKAMEAVFGGHHGIGNYDHSHLSSWRMYYRRAFRVNVARGGRLYRAIQYQYSWKRTQIWHRGRLRYLGYA